MNNLVQELIKPATGSAATDSESQRWIRSLKGEAKPPINAQESAAQLAQQRWPLLQSLRAKKWDTPTSLLASEKRRRGSFDASPSDNLEAMNKSVERKDLRASSLSAQLADGLNRMMVRNLTKLKSVAPVVQVAPIAPVIPASKQEEPLLSTLFSRVNKGNRVDSIVSTPDPTEQKFHDQQSPLPSKQPSETDDRLATIFKRLEMTNNGAMSNQNRPPSFLSRIGRR